VEGEGEILNSWPPKSWAAFPWQMLPEELGCGTAMTLAAPVRLATGGRVGSDPFCAVGLARARRPDQLVAGGVDRVDGGGRSASAVKPRAASRH